MYYFSLSYDSTARAVTLTVTLALVIATILLRLFRMPLWTVGTAMAINGSLLGLAWLYAPRGYRLEGQTLLIERRAGSLAIPLKDAWARLAHKEDVAALLSRLDYRGLFGYYGRFWSEALGPHEWYVTNKNKLVVLQTDGKVYILSPDQVDLFLDRINSLS